MKSYRLIFDKDREYEDGGRGDHFCAAGGDALTQYPRDE